MATPERVRCPMSRDNRAPATTMPRPVWQRIAPGARWLAAALLALLALPAPAYPLQQPRFERISAGVYALTAPPGPPNPENRGRTNNTGLLVGHSGVVVVDPGPSRKAGLQMLRAVRSLTRKPVVAVILTHAHPENVLAAGAVAGRHAPVIASHRTYALMRDRCSECLVRLTGLTGESAMSGTGIRLPDQTVAAGTTDRNYGGRMLKLIHTGWGHTAGDLAVASPRAVP